MAVRLDVACAVLAALAFLLYGADRAEVIRLPWRPAPEAGLRSALLQAPRTIDLETGEQGTAPADLQWGMAARDQPYLGVVQRGAAPGALIVQAGAARWEDLERSSLAKLSYTANQYSAWGPDAPVHPGALFAVRTAEGNFAKVRVAEIGRNYQLRLEWLLYAERKTGAGETVKAALPEKAAKSAASPGPPLPGPAPTWLVLRDDALAAYQAQRYPEALDACGKAIAAAAPAGAAPQALVLVTCGGLAGVPRRAERQVEDWLRQGVAIALKLEQGAIVSALGPREAMLKERGLRMLGVFYRDHDRPREAAEQFALAVDTVRAMAPPETGEHRMALRSDLYDLGLVLAQLGLRGTARQALGEARAYYVKTEPNASVLKAIDEQLQRLGDPAAEPAQEPAK